jgi:hypothetical protein
MPLETKLITLVGACFATAFLVYGNVQEVFYIQSLQYLSFAILGIVAASTPQFTLRVAPSATVATLGTLVTIIVHLVWEFVYPGYTAAFYREERLFGCYPVEANPAGGSFRWCGEHARINVPPASLTASPSLVLEAGPIPQAIKIENLRKQQILISIAPGEKRMIALNPLIEQNTATPQTIRIDASQSFVPSLLWPTSIDTRHLAVKVYE